MAMPRAFRSRLLQVGLVTAFLLLSFSLVLYWGRQKRMEPVSGVPSGEEITEFSPQLSEQPKKEAEAGQITTAERGEKQRLYPERRHREKSLHALRRERSPEGRLAFLQRRQSRRLLGSRRSQMGPGSKSLEQPGEKAVGGAQAERDQLGKKEPAAVQGLEGADPGSVLDNVMTALDNPDPEVREEALEALEGVDDEAINEALLKALADENADVRESAMDLMDDIQSPIILPSLEQALVAGDEDMQEAALSTLEDIPDPKAVELIIEKGLLSYNINISQEAFDSLEWITDQEFKSYDEAKKWWDANKDTFTFE